MKEILNLIIKKIIKNIDNIEIQLDIGLKSGALERNRTPNPLIRSQMLYPIELRVQHYYHINFSHYFQY